MKNLEQLPPNWKPMLKWELAWAPVEMACVGLGLYFMLKLGLDELGAGVLIGTLLLSGFVRYRHYLTASTYAGSPRN